MESKAKLFGHAAHPILIVFPLGLLSTSMIFDIVYLVSDAAVFAVVAYWTLTAGLIGGLLAAPFGWYDWFNIPSGTRAKLVGITHGLANTVAMLFFAASWVMRYGLPERPELIAAMASFIGFVFALFGGWLGGELVERLGVGVADGANLNAPNSLTSQNAESPRAAKASTYRF